MRTAAVAAGTAMSLVLGMGAAEAGTGGRVIGDDVYLKGTRQVRRTSSSHGARPHRAGAPHRRVTPAPPPPVWVYNTAPTPEQLAQCATELDTNPSCAGSGQWMTPLQAGAVQQQAAPGQQVVIQTPTLGAVIVGAQEQTKRLIIPPRRVAVEPGGGDVLVRMPTNLYTDNRALVRNVTVLGVPVTLSIYPRTFTWDTGDGGQVGPTRDPGAAYPVMTTAHTYTRAGSYKVSLTTTYLVTATIPGHGTITLPGQGETTQDVTTLQVHTSRTRLVAPSSH